MLDTAAAIRIKDPILLNNSLAPSYMQIVAARLHEGVREVCCDGATCRLELNGNGGKQVQRVTPTPIRIRYFL